MPSVNNIVPTHIMLLCSLGDIAAFSQSVSTKLCETVDDLAVTRTGGVTFKLKS